MFEQTVFSHFIDYENLIDSNIRPFDSYHFGILKRVQLEYKSTRSFCNIILPGIEGKITENIIYARGPYLSKSLDFEIESVDHDETSHFILACIFSEDDGIGIFPENSQSEIEYLDAISLTNEGLICPTYWSSVNQIIDNFDFTKWFDLMVEKHDLLYKYSYYS